MINSLSGPRLFNDSAPNNVNGWIPIQASNKEHYKGKEVVCVWCQKLSGFKPWCKTQLPWLKISRPLVKGWGVGPALLLLKGSSTQHCNHRGESRLPKQRMSSKAVAVCKGNDELQAAQVLQASSHPSPQYASGVWYYHMSCKRIIFNPCLPRYLYLVSTYVFWLC